MYLLRRFSLIDTNFPKASAVHNCKNKDITAILTKFHRYVEQWKIEYKIINKLILNAPLLH